MKNIFLLPTDQPSRLVKIKDTFFLTTTDDIPGGTFYNVYITSDEKIKEGDYCIDGNDIYGPYADGDIAIHKFIKIILSTDSQLIRYGGVQAIDDEFLEWFVKNPSCEFVEVNKKLVEFPLTFKMMYKIIIPQEESKQEILPEFKLSKDIFNKLSCLSSKDLSPELKQLVNDNWDYLIGADDVKNEIRYSEDEVRELLIKGLTHNDDKLCGSLVTVQKEIRTANFNVWFEENKKK